MSFFNGIMDLDQSTVSTLVRLLVYLFSSTVVCVALFVYLARQSAFPQTDKSVQIVVLGDVGRSPRTTYHALSVAKHGGQVDLVGYFDTPPHPDLVNRPSIRLHSLRPAPKKPRFLPFLLYAPIKVLWQWVTLLGCLLFIAKPSKWLLVQNPPSIPTLLVAALVCTLQQRRLVIDWHNYGFTILAGTRGARHPFVTVSRWLEFWSARFAHLHLAVTDAMARQLRNPPYGFKAPVLAVHDRPASVFQPVMDPEERFALLTRLINDKDLAFAVKTGVLRMVISSTSWTPDEDFGLLLDALTQYATADAESRAKASSNSNSNRPDFVNTPLLVVITGRGPQKEMYEARIAQLMEANRLPNVQFIMAFLPFEDYARLLAVADLGVCLHRSSSGVDLPMKVVDMFGAGIPVAAYSGYESFKELVREGENGCGFETAGELAETLLRLLSKRGQVELGHLRRGALKEGSRRWDAEWDPTVGKALGFIDD